MKEHIAAVAVFFAIIAALSSFLYLDGWADKKPLTVQSGTQQEGQTSQQPSKPIYIYERYENVERTELGNPNKELFKDLTSRNLWNIMVFDGGIFVGSGNYDISGGRAAISRYDIALGQWELCKIQYGDQVWDRTVEEQIADFKIIDGVLYTPGIDANDHNKESSELDSWDFGNYYVYDGTNWKFERTIPDGVHVFDVEKYNGELFFGIGTKNASINPIKVKRADGTYTTYPIFVDGVDITKTDELASFYRVYKIFTLNEKLYALLTGISNKGVSLLGFCEFDGEKFVLLSKVDKKVIRHNINRQTYPNDIAVWNGAFYYCTGKLFKTDDFQGYTEIVIPKSTVCEDITVCDGKLYALTSLEKKTEVETEAGNKKGIKTETKTEITYENTIWECVGDELKKVYSFEYGINGMSLVRDGDCFYVAMGHTNVESEQNGNIIKIEYK